MIDLLPNVVFLIGLTRKKLPPIEARPTELPSLLAITLSLTYGLKLTFSPL